MGVLDKARFKLTGQGASRLVPAGATSVKAEGSGGTWKLVFETPGGEVEVAIGSMERAVKLAMRLAREIARKRNQLPGSS